MGAVFDTTEKGRGLRCDPWQHRRSHIRPHEPTRHSRTQISNFYRPLPHRALQFYTLHPAGYTIGRAGDKKYQCSVSSQVRPTVLTRSSLAMLFPLVKYPAAIFASISTRESIGIRCSTHAPKHQPCLGNFIVEQWQERRTRDVIALEDPNT